MHYAISDSARPAPSNMLSKALPAAGSIGPGTTGRMRAASELHAVHGYVRSGTAGRGPGGDQWTRAGRGGCASTHAHLGTAGRGTRKVAAGRERPEELRDSERSHGYRCDAVPVCFQSLSQVMVDDSLQSFLK
jgi:hypothetical protein